MATKKKAAKPAENQPELGATPPAADAPVSDATVAVAPQSDAPAADAPPDGEAAGNAAAAATDGAGADPEAQNTPKTDTSPADAPPAAESKTGPKGKAAAKTGDDPARGAVAEPAPVAVASGVGRYIVLDGKAGFGAEGEEIRYANGRAAALVADKVLKRA